MALSVSNETEKSETLKTPKYVEMAEQVRKQIISGRLKPGDRLPSFARMRANYGIGQGTLERVHQFLEQEGLIVREPNRGIFVASPRRPAVGRGIGLLLHTSDKTHPYIVHLLAGIHARVKELGLELLLLNDKESVRWEKVSGALMYVNGDDWFEPRLPPGMPCITLLKSLQDLPCVGADDYQGGFKATHYLLGLGHRRIAYLVASMDDPFSQRRLAGYEAALREAGITPKTEWVRTIHERMSLSYRVDGDLTMRAWLREGWESLGCTALLTPNDEAAIGVMKACSEARLGVPDDVSVMGFDGTEVSEYSTPSLTTIKVPLYEIGERAVELLWSAMQEEQAEAQSAQLPVELVIHESCAPPHEG